MLSIKVFETESWRKSQMSATRSMTDRADPAAKERHSADPWIAFGAWVNWQPLAVQAEGLAKLLVRYRAEPIQHRDLATLHAVDTGTLGGHPGW
jgi:hypothetical protein